MIAEDVKRKRTETVAHAVGTILSCLGWAIFACSLIFGEYGSERTAMMVLAGIIIIPGWLLLRYCRGPVSLRAPDVRLGTPGIIGSYTDL